MTTGNWNQEAYMARCSKSRVRTLLREFRKILMRRRASIRINFAAIGYLFRLGRLVAHLARISVLIGL